MLVDLASEIMSLVGLNLSGVTLERFCIYFGLISRWQKAINLVSRGTLDDFWRRHIADSLQIISHITGNKVLDVGSGGGFPGMALAIVGAEDSYHDNGLDKSLNVTCIDSDRRKAIFLEEVARETGIKVDIVCSRIEDLDDQFDTITARGFSDLENLLPIASRFQAKGIFLKGKNLEKEIKDAEDTFKFKYEIFSSKIDSTGKIIVVDEISQVNSIKVCD